MLQNPMSYWVLSRYVWQFVENDYGSFIIYLWGIHDDIHDLFQSQTYQLYVKWNVLMWLFLVHNWWLLKVDQAMRKLNNEIRQTEFKLSTHSS